MENLASATNWTFFTNHAHVLLCIAQQPGVRMRDVADRVGITERAVQRIIDDLGAAGYIHVLREGRRNSYRINPGMRLRHPVEAHREVDGLIEFVLGHSARPLDEPHIESSEGKQ